MLRRCLDKSVAKPFHRNVIHAKFYIAKAKTAFKVSDYIQIEEAHGVREIMLNNPQTRNSLSKEMMTALKEAIEKKQDDIKLRAIVLSAKGTIWSAGHNLKEISNAMQAAKAKGQNGAKANECAAKAKLMKEREAKAKAKESEAKLKEEREAKAKAKECEAKSKAVCEAKAKVKECEAKLYKVCEDKAKAKDCEAKLKKDCEAKAKAKECEAKVKEVCTATAKAEECDAKLKKDCEAKAKEKECAAKAKLKEESDAKAKEKECEAKAKAKECEAKAKEIEAKLKEECEAKAKAKECEEKSKQVCEAKVKVKECEAKLSQVCEAKDKAKGSEEKLKKDCEAKAKAKECEAKLKEVCTATAKAEECDAKLKKDCEAKEAKKKAAFNAFEQLFGLVQAIIKSPVPVIAKVDGYAAAAGLQLALSCDITICTKRSQFSTPAVHIGLFGSTPGVAVSRLIPRSQALYMLFTGLPITADEAHAAGLVSKVVPDGMIDEVVEDFTMLLKKSSRAVVAHGKSTFYKTLDLPLEKAYAEACKAMMKNLEIPDSQEGVVSFLEKRKPKWTHKSA